MKTANPIDWSAHLQDWGERQCMIVASAVVMAVRLSLLLVFALLALAEPFIALVLCGLGYGLFFFTVLFGFILQAPFPHRWGMLLISVICLAVYLAYIGAMHWVARWMS